MSTTTHSQKPLQFARVMLLGLVMALGIAALAEPEQAWLGFALAAIHRERYGCWAR